MAKSHQDNFIRCHRALHILLENAIPSLQNVIDLWHLRTKDVSKPCSNPTQCLPYKKPSQKNKSCPECIVWAGAIEDQVYPPSSCSLQWMNGNPVHFYDNPLEVIKLFVLRMPASQRDTYSSFHDFDSASLLMIMTKFKEFNQGNQALVDMIEKVRLI